MDRTGTDVKENVYKWTRFTDDAVFTGDYTAEESFVEWINEALRKLSDLGLTFGHDHIHARGCVYYDLPVDCLMVISVGRHGCEYYGWRVLGNQIAFEDHGHYDVQYKLTPTPTREDYVLQEITTLTDTLPYGNLYFDAICSYCKYAIYYLTDEESKVANDWLDKFAQQAITVFNTYSKNKGPRQMRVQRHA